MHEAVGIMSGYGVRGCALAGLVFDRRGVPTMSVDRSSEVQWREWGDESLGQAEREDKLILVDISAPWCHWCHVMDRTTYSNPEIIRFINERFVPIRVNGDKRPDLQDRYLLGGWPTTAFLLPDGRMLSGTTFVPPGAMIRKLQETDDLYREHKSLVTAQAASMTAHAEAQRSEAETPILEFDTEYIDNAVEVLKRDFDSVHGGFGSDPKFPFPDARRFAFRRYRQTGDKEMLEIALKSLDGLMALYDPEWGGFYRYALNADWTGPHFEKLLYVQAGAIESYAEAYQVTGDDKYGETAAGVKAYVERFLTDHDRGGFYASQDADVDSHDPDADIIFGEEFFPLDEAGRLSVGMPDVDKMVYTDWNGMMISAYLRLFHVMGDEHAKEFALRTTDRLLARNMQGDRMCHFNDGEPRLCGVLSDQVYFGQALVDMYQSTGQRRYLIEAEKLAYFMSRELQDVVDGGFYFNTFDPHAKGEVLERHKPFDENVAAAQFMTQIFYLTGEETYRSMAARTLRALAYPQLMGNIVGVGYALALDVYLNRPLHIVVVGKPDSSETQAMLETSLHAYEPSKLVQVLDPSEDDLTIGDTTYQADEEETLAYVCVRDMCHPPVKGSRDLAVMLEEVLGS